MFEKNIKLEIEEAVVTSEAIGEGLVLWHLLHFVKKRKKKIVT